MKKKNNRTKKKDADYCSTSRCNNHNTEIGGMIFGSDTCVAHHVPYVSQGYQGDYPIE